MPDALEAGRPQSRDKEKEAHRQKLLFSGTENLNVFRSRSNSEHHKNPNLKANYNMNILVYRSDGILSVVSESFYQQRKMYKLNGSHLSPILELQSIDWNQHP